MEWQRSPDFQKMFSEIERRNANRHRTEMGVWHNAI